MQARGREATSTSWAISFPAEISVSCQLVRRASPAARWVSRKSCCGDMWANSETLSWGKKELTEYMLCQQLALRCDKDGGVPEVSDLHIELVHLLGDFAARGRMTVEGVSGTL